jgi:hypothetical protein
MPSIVMLNAIMLSVVMLNVWHFYDMIYHDLAVIFRRFPQVQKEYIISPPHYY